MPHATRRAFSAVELLLVIGLASLVSSVAFSRAKPTLELFQYRSLMQQLAAELQTMKFRSRNEGRTFIMRIDRASGMVQVVAEDRAAVPAVHVQRTMWLPEGLSIIQAPKQVLATPFGHLQSTAIVVEAEAFQRIFRLTTTPAGVVDLNEEPST
jgi:Tfp pilus assembly protein FimT